MNIDIRGVHFDITDATREYIDKKLERIDYAEDLIIDFLLVFTKETKGLFTAECTLNFRWGKSAHLKVESYDLYEAIDKLFDKTEMKISKEKKKIQEH
ncbi:MAG: ribosome hibernation-promoting factor, HPF/YfiA family [Spirochaetia bacterium]